MPASIPAGVNSSHQDANQQYSTLLVSGTLGTTDTGGTALTMPASGNPVTGAAYVELVGGALSGTSTVTIIGGTLQNLNGGSIVVTSIPQVSVGTIPQASIGTIPQVSVGTLPALNIASGTQQTLGTVGSVNGVAVVSALTNGSVNILTGTLQSSGNGTIVGGTLQNISGGSIVVTAGTVDTELPAAALVGSNTANPTVPGVQTFPMIWDGSNWQRLPGDINGGAVVRQFQSAAADADTISNTAAAPQSSSGNPFYHRVTEHIFNGATWERVRDANIVNNTVGTGLLGVGIIGQDSGGTYHSIAVTTGGSIGTIIMPQLAVGTVTTGTIQNLVTGTINALAAGTITGGTLQNLNNGTLALVTTVSNVTNGSINMLTGTAQLLGTLQLGTMKLDPTTIPQMIQFGTLGTAGGSFFATLSAVSGAGTKQYIQGVDVVMQSGTADVRILAGSAIQGTGVLAGGVYGPTGGISKNWSPHFNTGTNSELLYHFVGAGTAFITISYWKGA